LLLRTVLIGYNALSQRLIAHHPLVLAWLGIEIAHDWPKGSGIFCGAAALELQGVLSLIALHTLYHPPSSLFYLHYNQFNPTCFSSHHNRICQLISDFEIGLPGALVLAALFNGCCGPCQAPLFSANGPPSPQARAYFLGY
jgi:hypothetical protein